MIEHMPDELSDGQRQRVAIGRAIVMDPEVILMDEQLANLDAELRVYIQTELQRLQHELDITTVYATHDQAEAMTMSDRTAIINRGELQQFALPLECHKEPANLFVAGLVGPPIMHFVNGTVKGGRFVGSTFGFDVDVSDAPVKDGDDVVLGVRPEDGILNSSIGRSTGRQPRSFWSTLSSRWMTSWSSISGRTTAT